jgi:hypothetical protein
MEERDDSEDRPHHTTRGMRKRSCSVRATQAVSQRADEVLLTLEEVFVHCLSVGFRNEHLAETNH